MYCKSKNYQQSHEIIHIVKTVVHATPEHGPIRFHLNGCLATLALCPLRLGRLLLFELGRMVGLGLCLDSLEAGHVKVHAQVGDQLDRKVQVQRRALQFVKLVR